MSCFLSEIDKENRRINNEIERQIKKDKLNYKKELKLLILGTGESGKSTFIKQMRILHGSGYNDEDKKLFIKLIINNIFIALNSMIDAMQLLGIQYKLNENKENAKKLRALDFESMKTLDTNLADIIKQLWTDEGINQVYSRRREYQLIESAK